MTKRLSFDDGAKDGRPGLIKVSTVYISQALLLRSSLGFVLGINVASSIRVPSLEAIRLLSALTNSSTLIVVCLLLIFAGLRVPGVLL